MHRWLYEDNNEDTPRYKLGEPGLKRSALSISFALVIVLTGTQLFALDTHANSVNAQLGIATTNEKTISIGYGYGMVIKDDDSLWAWGVGILGDGVERDWQSPALTPVKILDSVLSVSSYDTDSDYDNGTHTTFAIRTDKSLYAWGTGILGDGVERDWQDPALTPVRIMDSVKSVYANDEQTFAIQTDGSLWAWGFGILGDGVERVWENPALTPVKIMDSVASVYPSYYRVFAVQTDGSLWAWGTTLRGLLGCGRVGSFYDFRTTPVKIMDSVTTVWIAWENIFVIKTDGSLWAWGSGHLGDGRTRSTPELTPVKIMDAVVSFSGQRALKADGSLWAWGSNWGGELGDGTAEIRNRPVRILDSVATIIDTGSFYSMVIRTDGSLWAWGYNIGGQLGDGTASGFDFGSGNIYFEDEYPGHTYIDNDRRSPIQIIEEVVSVSTFEAFPGSTIVLRTDGSLWAWGSNHNGQLGDGTREHRLSPVKILDGARLPRAADEPEFDDSDKPEEPPDPSKEQDVPNEPTGETEESPYPPRASSPAGNLTAAVNRDTVLYLLLPVCGHLVIGGGVLAVLYVIRRRKGGSRQQTGNQPGE